MTSSLLIDIRALGCLKVDRASASERKYFDWLEYVGTSVNLLYHRKAYLRELFSGLHGTDQGNLRSEPLASTYKAAAFPIKIEIGSICEIKRCVLYSKPATTTKYSKELASKYLLPFTMIMN